MSRPFSNLTNFDCTSPSSKWSLTVNWAFLNLVHPVISLHNSRSFATQHENFLLWSVGHWLPLCCHLPLWAPLMQIWTRFWTVLIVLIIATLISLWYSFKSARKIRKASVEIYWQVLAFSARFPTRPQNKLLDKTMHKQNAQVSSPPVTFYCKSSSSSWVIWSLRRNDVKRLRHVAMQRVFWQSGMRKTWAHHTESHAVLISSMGKN